MDKRISDFSQIAEVNEVELKSGKGKGLTLFEVSNGVLDFTLVADKALDVAKLKFKGETVNFISKCGLVNNSAPFEKVFNGGMLYTCGLDSVGGREGYPLHGTLHNIPAKVISTVCNKEIIEITAEIEDTALFGKNLKVVRKIITAPNSDKLTVRDEITNCGTRDEDYCLLYHVNVGFPFLDESCRIIADIKETLPRTPHAKKHIDKCLQMEMPIDNFEETCYFHTLNSPEVTVFNESKKRSFKLSYFGSPLKYVVEWKSLASHDYVLGIEPTTTLLDDRFEYSRLAVGESVTCGISIELK